MLFVPYGEAPLGYAAVAKLRVDHHLRVASSAASGLTPVVRSYRSAS
jgi:hypothetical protein